MRNESAITLSIIIVNYNTRAHLQRCLKSITDFPPSVQFEVIAVDNDSKDGSADMVALEFPNYRLIRNHSNDGYGVAINRAADTAHGNWLMFLNPDIEITSGAFDTLLAFGNSHPRAGVISPRLLYGNGQSQPSARRFLSSTLLIVEMSRLHFLLPARMRSAIFLGTYFNQDRTMKVPWVCGACHMLPRAVWNKVGPLTEETFCGSDDYDYCYRVHQNGYEVWLVANATMVHHCSVAVKERWQPWDVDQLAMHNFYVVLESHWPRWRLKTYYLVELGVCASELLRDKLRKRKDQDDPTSSYRDRLRKRMTLILNLFLGKEHPRRRFEPKGRQNEDRVVPPLTPTASSKVE